ncbi:kremen protein 1 isoform X1 [Octopus bimaculoides]|uniref:kremen protein 1 isoform X1 n=1 Tax=Octopus bimaculoides TaxID=37653 RepID=UPI00071E2DE9|nr:kremen protein 1 isoform X1 [Octopus bimaculoides]|eukprot:XP_014769413.1 PREDICTED: kremen protein 1-like isoform X1 [Octopus bimaculoides]
MTIEKCQNHCRERRTKYAGLQHGQLCYCGNTYEIYGPLGRDHCNIECAGDPTEFCGGYLANSVFSTHSELVTTHFKYYV